jgi:hypothetical protein
MAHQRGYGVIVDPSGNSVEYLGMAKDGLPSGPGGQIARFSRQTGALYHEGSFANGLPNGVVRVEEAGARPRIREFRAGKDVGSGAAEQWTRLTF